MGHDSQLVVRLVYKLYSATGLICSRKICSVALIQHARKHKLILYHQANLQCSYIGLLEKSITPDA